MSIDFVELGKYCQTEYKTSLDGIKNKYIQTLFVAIKEDNSILVSSTPHILANASKCMLIHERSSLAITNWHSWYVVQFINENGEVSVNRIDDEFALSIAACGHYDNQMLELSGDHCVYCSWRKPWEKCIKPMWSLYVRLKSAKSKSERELIASLFRKEQEILDLEKKNRDFEYKTLLLEKEKDLYKGLLDEIKDLFEKNRFNK